MGKPSIWAQTAFEDRKRTIESTANSWSWNNSSYSPTHNKTNPQFGLEISHAVWGTLLGVLLQGWAEVFRQNFNHQHQELVIEYVLLNNNSFINIKLPNYSMWPSLAMLYKRGAGFFDSYSHFKFCPNTSAHLCTSEWRLHDNLLYGVEKSISWEQLNIQAPLNSHTTQSKLKKKEFFFFLFFFFLSSAFL